MKIKFILLILFIYIGSMVICYAEEMDLTKAVIHHTASPDVSVKEIDRWHKERGWDSIGYHFVIRADGTIEEGRPLTKKGAHTKGRNHYIGIVLTGYDMFTEKQIQSLIKLLIKLKIAHIERHHENCPGKGLNLEIIRNEISKVSKTIR